MVEELTHISLFTGIGGIDLAAEWAGFKTILMVENNAYCQKVLRKHWSGVPIIGDIKDVKGNEWTATLITGGFPCQPVSQAGKRRGKEDDRYLWPEMLRVIKEVRPRWVVAENVAGLITMGLDDCLSDLEREGYITETFLIPACAVNAPHRRDRIFIVAHAELNGQPGSERRGSTTEESGTQSTRANHSLDSQGASGYATSKQDVAHAVGRGEQQPEGHITEGRGWTSNGSEDAPDTEGTRLERSDTTRDSCSRGCSPEPGQRERQADWWSVESTLGRETPRLPRGMDRNLDAWAEGWEDGIPRVATGVKNRVDRLKALGNAVVPQQIYPVLKAIADIESSFYSVNP